MSKVKKPWRAWKHDFAVIKSLVEPFLVRLAVLKRGEEGTGLRFAKLPPYVLFGLECLGYRIDEEPWIDIETLFRETTVEEIETSINAQRFRPWQWPETESVENFDKLTAVELEECEKISVGYTDLWCSGLEAPYTITHRFAFTEKVLDQLRMLFGDPSIIRHSPVQKNGTGVKRMSLPATLPSAKKVRTVTKTQTPFLRSGEDAFRARALKLLRKNLPPPAFDENDEPAGWVLEYVTRPDTKEDHARDLRMRCMLKSCGSTVKISPQSVRSADGLPSPNVTPAKCHLLKCIARHVRPPPVIPIKENPRTNMSGESTRSNEPSKSSDGQILGMPDSHSTSTKLVDGKNIRR